MLQQQGQSGGNAVSSKEVDLAYNALGQFTTIADFNYLNGGPRLDIATGAYSYDTGNRLTGLAYSSNAGKNQIDAFGWGYDAANNVTSFSTNSGTATYGNDATNQLTSASYTGTNQPANETYSYDTNGNRTMAGYTTGADNLLTSDGTFNYQHDADGNQTVRTRISSTYASDYKTTYAWDYRNRLTDVEFFDNNNVLTKHVHYVYDVYDNLIGDDIDSTGSGSYDTTENFVLDVSPKLPVQVLSLSGTIDTSAPDDTVLESINGALAHRFFNAPSLSGADVVAVEEAVNTLTAPGTDRWMLTNNQGTPTDIEDVNGVLIDHMVDSLTGLPVYESNPAVHHLQGYAGGMVDPNTGLIKFGDPWYDPATVTWLSQSPIGIVNGDPNLTRFAGNHPTNITSEAHAAPGVLSAMIAAAGQPPPPGRGNGGNPAGDVPASPQATVNKAPQNQSPRNQPPLYRTPYGPRYGMPPTGRGPLPPVLYRTPYGPRYGIRPTGQDPHD